MGNSDYAQACITGKSQGNPLDLWVAVSGEPLFAASLELGEKLSLRKFPHREAETVTGHRREYTSILLESTRNLFLARLAVTLVNRANQLHRSCERLPKLVEVRPRVY